MTKRRILRGILVAALVAGVALSATSINGVRTFLSYFDVSRIVAPSNPAASFLRLYADNSSGKLACLDSGGSNCMPAGGSTATVGTFATLTASSPADGTVGIPTDSYYDTLYRSAGSWRFFTDGREMFPVVLGGFTPVNVGSTTNSTTHGSVTLFSNGANGGLTAYMKAAPGATFTLIGQSSLTQYTTFGNQGGCASIAVSDGTKYETMTVNVNGSVFVSKWLTTATFSLDVFNTDSPSTGYLNNSHNVYFRVTQDATNLTYYFSSDGQNWFQAYQEAKGSFFTTQASTAGFAIDIRGTRNTTCTFITSEAN